MGQKEWNRHWRGRRGRQEEEEKEKEEKEKEEKIKRRRKAEDDDESQILNETFLHPPAISNVQMRNKRLLQWR